MRFVKYSSDDGNKIRKIFVDFLLSPTVKHKTQLLDFWLQPEVNEVTGVFIIL